MKRTRMWQRARLGLVCLTLSGGLAWGQAATTTITVPQTPLLPEKFAGWELEGIAPGCSDCYHGEQAQEPVLREDGFRRGSHQTYHKPGTGESLDVRALQFDDVTGAVAAFTYLRSPEMKIVPLQALVLRLPQNASSDRLVSLATRVGQEEATGGGQYLIREGATVVLAQAAPGGAARAEDLRALAATLPKIGGPKGAPPLLPALLPAEGLVPGSVHYAVGPVGYAAMGGTLPAATLGFEKSAEAVTAEYAGRAGKGLLTLLLFPTPEIAGDRGRAVEAALNAAGERAGTAKLRREGPLVMLARGGFSPAEAQALVDNIHLRTEVTWNKPVPPEFHTEVRKTASLLVSIAVFSGVMGLAAVLLGLFLGFGRAYIRVLMGKPAATEPEFLRLDLSPRSADRGSGRV